MAYKKNSTGYRGGRSTRSSRRVRSKSFGRKTSVRRNGKKSSSRGAVQTVRLVIEQPSINSVASVNPNTFAPANDVKKKEAKF